jgi:glucose/arabinose dehydrogenase
VTGSERLAWDQAVESFIDLDALEFLVYVDEVAVLAAGVVCDPQPTPSGFVCTAPFPAMPAGKHTLAMATRIHGTTRESPRSEPIEVVVAADASFTSSVAPARTVTGDGVHLRTKLSASGIEDATDMVAITRGAMLIAERAGRIRMFRPGEASLPVAEVVDDLDVSSPGSGLLALAATRHEPVQVFALHTTRNGARLVRYTMRGDRLTGRGVLLDALPISRQNPRASMRVGPDGMLYIALDDAGDANRVGDMGSLSGKILRLNLDGTTPPDATAPVHAIGAGRPVALAWNLDGSWFSLLSTGADGIHLLSERNAATVKRFSLPAGAPAVSMWRYDGGAIAGFRGDLLIAREQSLLRVTSNSQGTIVKTEVLFDGQLEDVRALSSDGSGNLFLISGGHLLLVTSTEPSQ